jgi:hypothetical protein
MFLILLIFITFTKLISMKNFIVLLSIVFTKCQQFPCTVIQTLGPGACYVACLPYRCGGTFIQDTNFFGCSCNSQLIDYLCDDLCGPLCVNICGMNDNGCSNNNNQFICSCH